METINIFVHVPVRPTERVERIVKAIENIFPGLSKNIHENFIDAYDGLGSMQKLHRILREQRILDVARSIMITGKVRDIIEFDISKQAAFMGILSFPPEEEPLGSIHVQIKGDERLLEWLAPKTENGAPIAEIDLLLEMNERVDSDV